MKKCPRFDGAQINLPAFEKVPLSSSWIQRFDGSNVPFKKKKKKEKWNDDETLEQHKIIKLNIPHLFHKGWSMSDKKVESKLSSKSIACDFKFKLWVLLNFQSKTLILILFVLLCVSSNMFERFDLNDRVQMIKMSCLQNEKKKQIPIQFNGFRFLSEQPMAQFVPIPLGWLCAWVWWQWMKISASN